MQPAFKTKDGRYFDDKREAEAYEMLLAFYEKHADKKLYGSHEGCVFYLEDLAQYIYDNFEVVRELMHLVQLTRNIGDKRKC